MIQAASTMLWSQACEDYKEATYRDRRNKATQQNILTLHYDNLYDKACELETAQSF